MSRSNQGGSERVKRVKTIPVAAYAHTVVTGEAKLVNPSASSSWEISFLFYSPGSETQAQSR